MNIFVNNTQEFAHISKALEVYQNSTIHFILFYNHFVTKLQKSKQERFILANLDVQSTSNLITKIKTYNHTKSNVKCIVSMYSWKRLALSNTHKHSLSGLAHISTRQPCELRRSASNSKLVQESWPLTLGLQKRTTLQHENLCSR